ncbi:MAG: DUF2065 domain-containing protein [Azoarcus sp.]|jgi:uncharacterized protein YjeT (DUF2065 family)|nr:DUF2065 domain-containing protein [Azoarcus sp.]MDR1228658.1 DUF2065 domain-containing protein [Azoarcus sp.]
MGATLLTAIALMLILEGCIPLFAPALWREVFLFLTSMKTGQIRYAGLSSVLAGAVLLLLLLVWN